MIKEFAIEPSAITGLDRLRVLTDNCGIHLGRIISLFPEKWPVVVIEQLKQRAIGDLELKRVIEWMSLPLFKYAAMKRDDAVFNPTDPWLQNALAEHARKNFAAIVAVENPQAHPAVLSPEDVNGDCPAWKIVHCQTIARTSTEMAAVARPLLTISRDIMFVDPWFRPWKHRFVRSLRAFLSPLKPIRVRTVEYHVNDQLEDDAGCPLHPARFFDRCRVALPTILPSGMRIEIVIWPKQAMHNRYVITELGGILFGHGLDEGRGEDEVTLMNPEAWKKRWEQFGPTRTARPIASMVFSASQFSVKALNPGRGGIRR